MIFLNKSDSKMNWNLCQTGFSERKERRSDKCQKLKPKKKPSLTKNKYSTEPHNLSHSPTWGECGGSV